MSFIDLTPGEIKIIEELKTLKPFEEMRIVADATGKPDTFFVSRQSKVIVKGLFVTYVK